MLIAQQSFFSNIDAISKQGAIKKFQKMCDRPNCSVISKSRQMQNTNLKIDLPNIMIKNVCFHKFIFVSNS